MNRRASTEGTVDPRGLMAGTWMWVLIHVNGEYRGGEYRCIVCGFDDNNGFNKGCNA